MNSDDCKIFPISYIMSFHKSMKKIHKCFKINGYALEKIIPNIFDNAVLDIFPLLCLPSSFL